MPLAEYLADPCPEPSLSSSAAMTLLTRSPLHCWHEHPRLNPEYVSEQANRLDIGAAAHALFLEQDDSRFVVIEADDWRTKAAQAARDEAHAAGLIPLLTHQHDKVVSIAEASEAALARCDELSGIVDDAIVEHVCTWQEDGTWCRARPDLVAGDKKIVLNYKTTEASASPEPFGAGVLTRSGYHVQAFHHAQGVATVCQCELPKCVWLVQEVEPPYAASILGMSPSLLELASIQWAQALNIWRMCLRFGEWPAYPSRICWIEARPWDLERWKQGATGPDSEQTKYSDAKCPATGISELICRCERCEERRNG